LARQLLAVNETRRLYRLVTEAADERRRLLADVMRSVDEDRHRVASQLHDQAIFSYVAFDSMTRTASDAAPASASTLLAGVSARVRDDLAGQAESLRQLMLAVRPLTAGGARSQAAKLTSPIRAYVDNLYGDAPPPTLRVEIDDAIHVYWTTETILLRIVQEAVGNVSRHAAARELAVSIAVVDDAVEMTVTDDGDGFDPAAVPRESGLATMRSFAALAGASLAVDSTPGEGTTVRVRFGDDTAMAPATPPSQPSGRPHLTIARGG
jgi:signal transduction histidine kinase